MLEHQKWFFNYQHHQNLNQLRFHRHTKSSRCEVQFISLGIPKSSYFLSGVGGEKISVKLTAEEALKKKWASPSSQLTRDHFSRDDDHPLVFKLGSETVVKSSCFTIIDYLPKRSLTYISIAQKASGKAKDFVSPRQIRCLQIRINFLIYQHTRINDKNEA